MKLDETQEINYRYVAQVIADLGYTGYVSHEYHPTEGRDFVANLKASRRYNACLTGTWGGFTASSYH